MQRPVSSIRSVLVGFAGLLLLMGCLAVDAALQTRNVSATSTALRKQSRDRDTLLDQLRTDTYRSSTLVRDYVLEHDDVVAASHKAELEQLRSRGEQALRRLGDNPPRDEKAAIQSLQQHFASYWTSLAPALDWDRTERGERSQKFLQNVIVARRDMVQFAKQVNALDERVLDAGEAQIQTLQTRFQRRVTVLSTGALLLGSILVVIVVRHAHRLGAEAGARFDEVETAREDLRRLSERLVRIQEDERRRLSRELHDELGQSMSVMLIELGTLDSVVSNVEVHSERLASVRRLAEENVAKVRNMALLLRPAMLDELGLIPALRWQAREVGRRTGLKVKMIADELDEDLPDATRTCIYRVVQEALNNCVKHSQAQEVRVVLHRDVSGLAISVQDNGVGFDPVHNKGLGLLGMTERVTGLGGRFHIDSQPGRGSILSTFFPLEGGLRKSEQESVV